MSQINSGLRSVLSIPFVYDVLQNIMGAHKVRSQLVEQFILPFPGAKILDIGCGTAEILNYLSKDLEYVGYDISEHYIAVAKKRFGERGNFTCGYFDEIQAKKQSSFDIVLILGALHHLDDDVAQKLISLVLSVLSPSGRLITIDPCFEKDQNPIARFLISKDRGQNVRDKYQYLKLINPYFSDIKSEVIHRKWIPYTHIIMQCTR
jgi:ubiquinone/menaquinone biosynthesis C-methylase UbiE